MLQNKSVQGILLVALAAMLWGTTGTAQSFAQALLSPYWVGTLRLVISAIFFICYAVLIVGLSQSIIGLKQIDWRYAAIAGLCMAVYNMSFFAGVKATGVAIGTALAIGSGPIWAGMLQMLAGSLPNRSWWYGTLLAVGGGVLLAISQSTEIKIDMAGIGLCLTAGFAYAAYAILNKQLVSRSHPVITTLAIFSIGSLLAIPAAWSMAGTLQISGSDWLLVGFLGIVSTGIAYLLFSSGLRHISAAGGVSLALIEPVTAFILAIIIVGERPQSNAYLGMLLLLLGLTLVIRSETRQSA